MSHRAPTVPSAESLESDLRSFLVCAKQRYQIPAGAARIESSAFLSVTYSRLVADQCAIPIAERIVTGEYNDGELM